MTDRKLKIYAIVVTVLFVFAAASCLFLVLNDKNTDFTEGKTEVSDSQKVRTLAFNGWNNTMMKLDYDSDIVFFGDSHTARSDFREFFPDKKTVTLGCPGDNLLGMQKRVPGIAAVTPEQVFVLGGENGLKADNIDKSIGQYENLITTIKEELPDTQLIILSALPVREDNRLGFCSNDVIVGFNEKLKPLAEDLGCDYVDIYSLYLDENGELDETLTEDGVHLKPEAYDRWAEAIRQYVG